MTTTPTPNQPTARFSGLVARPSLWHALGAAEAYAYTNGPGPVRWHLASHPVGTTEAYALELLTRARAELPTESSDEAIVTRAVVLRAGDRPAQALLELGRGLSDLAQRGVTITAAVRAQIEQVVSQLPGSEEAS